MVPHIIHYCWFGGKPLPAESKKFIESWKKYFPDWEVKEWNEHNFDVNAVPYTAQAYKAGKYAFVSDYARFWILYNFGGVYFDTDVEVIRPMIDIVEAGAFMGCEKSGAITTVNPGVGIGAPAAHPFYKEMLDLYAEKEFSTEENIVDITTRELNRYGLENTIEKQNCAEITIYPVEYFCPIDYETRELKITDRTRTIHHFAESWIPRRTRIINAVGRKCPWAVRLCVKVKSVLK